MVYILYLYTTYRSGKWQNIPQCTLYSTIYIKCVAAVLPESKKGTICVDLSIMLRARRADTFSAWNFTRFVCSVARPLGQCDRRRDGPRAVRSFAERRVAAPPARPHASVRLFRPSVAHFIRLHAVISHLRSTGCLYNPRHRAPPPPPAQLHLERKPAQLRRRARSISSLSSWFRW